MNVGTEFALLERERELARVSELVDATVAGEFRLAVVEGPAGAGKSAILSACAAYAKTCGARVLRATGLELEREYPFGVVRQLFEPAVYELDDAVRRDVFAGAATLAEQLLVGSGGKFPSGSGDAAFALSHSLYWALVGFTDLCPVALVVDDVQWADVLSLRFLAFACKRAEGLPLLVGLARRDGVEQSDALAAVVAAPARVIRPGPLSASAIALLLAEATGGDIDDETVADAERLTGGNPLYVHELVDTLGAARGADHDAGQILRAAAPAAVGRRVQAALARLDAVTRGIATAVAILGDEVPLHRTALFANVRGGAAGAAADELARAGILVVGEPLRFRHPLVRDAVLDSIEPRAQAGMHARAAQLLISLGEPPDRAALHMLESDPAADPQVVSTLRQAAENAVLAAAPELAIMELRRALDEPPSRTERPLVLNQLARIEARLGDLDGAFEHFGEAFATAGSLDQLADGVAGYVALLKAKGRVAEAEDLGDRVLDALGDRERRLMLEAELAGWSWGEPRRDRLGRVTAALRGETPAERLLLGLQACDAAQAGSAHAAETAVPVRQALAGGRLLAELGPGSSTYWSMLFGLVYMDELDLLACELEIAIPAARREGASFGLSMALGMLSTIAFRRGRLAEAEADARTAVEIAAQMGWLATAPIGVGHLLRVLVDAGDLDEADRYLQRNQFGGRLPAGPSFGNLLEARGRLRLSQGRAEEGIDDLQAVTAWMDEVEGMVNVRASHAAWLVPALMHVGREGEAGKLAARTLLATRTSGVPRYIAAALRACALAHTAGPDIDQLHEAAVIYERINAPVELARTLIDIGSTLRRRRKPAAAREPLRRALDLARACGARPVAERAEYELRAAGARPRRDRITGRDALTATEQRVAHLAIEGMTNRQIAETLFVTKKTVESHLARVFQKLGIHARSDLQRALDATGELS